jgi:hypothetical protein
MNSKAEMLVYYDVQIPSGYRAITETVDDWWSVGQSINTLWMDVAMSGTLKKFVHSKSLQNKENLTAL